MRCSKGDTLFPADDPIRQDEWGAKIADSANKIYVQGIRLGFWRAIGVFLTALMVLIICLWIISWLLGGG